VERAQLEELRGLCREVLADHDRAEELLPTQSGFFFGETAYDEYYFEDLEHTEKELTRLLEMNTDDGFYYHSSW
jgi:hypothetical protein